MVVPPHQPYGVGDYETHEPHEAGDRYSRSRREGGHAYEEYLGLLHVHTQIPRLLLVELEHVEYTSVSHQHHAPWDEVGEDYVDVVPLGPYKPTAQEPGQEGLDVGVAT